MTACFLRLTDVGQVSHECETSVSFLWDSCPTLVRRKICRGN